jgi:serine/threonine protein kinase
MDSDFWTIVSALAPKNQSGAINIGPIVKRLVEIVKAIHKIGRILVDIKPENFMLAAAKTASGSAVTVESLAGRIRAIDFGLVQIFNEYCGHRPNVTGGELQGTPLYASLNVHGGETPSR